MTARTQTSAFPASAVRNLLKSYQLDACDPNAEEDEENLEKRRQLTLDLRQSLRSRQLVVRFDGGRPVVGLRAPLDLVDLSTVSQPRWPVEREVIGAVIEHIEWDPPDPEPFYRPTGLEVRPEAAGGQGQLVFCSDLATKHPYFSGSVGGSREPVRSPAPFDDPSSFTLEFESRFESGNLLKAVRVGLHDYQLTLRPDLYTSKHMQWFYFRVRKMRAGATYRFTIINLTKSRSLYCHGMKPLLYSERAAEERGEGWRRTGANIRYFQNCSQDAKESSSEVVVSYSLTWTLQFPYDSDTCYLAHCYPYTYSHLQRYLRRIPPAAASYCKVRVLCHSLAGNAVHVLTVTSESASRREAAHKRAVVLTARVHPGETNASWVMEGLLDFLLGDSEDAQVLRDNFVFKVVPMLNPDGVVVGNYRCSLAGRDLNRYYRSVLRESFPGVWHTKNMVERLRAEMEVALYCDFHGHNRKNNAFMYGCSGRGDKLQERVFPLMMSKNAGCQFSFQSCKFRVQKSKEGTGRICMWRLGIQNSYTMETSFGGSTLGEQTSFGGSTLGDRKGTHFTTRDLKSLGFYFCDTLLDYCDPDPAKVIVCSAEVEMQLKKKVRRRKSKEGSTGSISLSDLETNTSGSNSSDSDGPPVHLLNLTEAAPPEGLQTGKQPVGRKNRLKTRKDRNRLRSGGRTRNRQQTPDSDPHPPHGSAVRERSSRTGPDPPPQESRRRQLRRLTPPPSRAPPRQRSRPVQVKTGRPGSSAESHATEAARCFQVRGQRSAGSWDLPLKAKAAPAAAAPRSGDPAAERPQWRCSTQLLHLKTFLLPPLHPRRPHPSLASAADHRGHRKDAHLCASAAVPPIMPPLSRFSRHLPRDAPPPSLLPPPPHKDHQTPHRSFLPEHF
ncbi:cytosolic carboxypeptidase 2 isoform X4 [Oryzias latipes]|uniref:cytosolic carboxypeptidase 2 isoform X4 n=1 Tax=Oryzias latipes TaxID=8090 RepID=UPI000CE26076|nr:cytosolic carboxypeptidase 2 isoform X4 [Oryzias latipes]